MFNLVDSRFSTFLLNSATRIVIVKFPGSLYFCFSGFGSLVVVFNKRSWCGILMGLIRCQCLFTVVLILGRAGWSFWDSKWIYTSIYNFRYEVTWSWIMTKLRSFSLSFREYHVVFLSSLWWLDRIAIFDPSLLPTNSLNSF